MLFFSPAGQRKKRHFQIILLARVLVAASLVLLLPWQQSFAAAAGQQIKKAGELYRNRDYQGSLNLLFPLARSDHPRAQAIVAMMYRFGEGVEKDLRQTFSWYQRSANLGYAPAQYNLGIMLAEGHGVVTDLDAARFWLNAAAEQGHSRAQAELARLNRVSRYKLDPREQAWSRKWDFSLPSQESIHNPGPQAAAPASSRQAARGSSAAPTYRVQLGAMSNPASARKLWHLLSDRIAPLRGVEASFVTGQDSLVRVQAGSFSDAEIARSFCDTLLGEGLESGCVLVLAEEAN